MGEQVEVEVYGQICAATVIEPHQSSCTIRLEDGRCAGVRVTLHDMYLHGSAR